MDDLIAISKINDFLYCPLSLYLHLSYEDFDQKNYHEVSQTAGKLVHQNIEDGVYSSAKRYLQALDVYCEKYGLVGKIDIYDSKEKTLIERKNKVKQVYLGYKYQLYAEMFCMVEMGFKVEKLFVHSLANNKRYPIPLPSQQEILAFEKVLQKMRVFDQEDILRHTCRHCKENIYSSLGFGV